MNRLERDELVAENLRLRSNIELLLDERNRAMSELQKTVEVAQGWREQSSKWELAAHHWQAAYKMQRDTVAEQEEFIAALGKDYTP